MVFGNEIDYLKKTATNDSFSAVVTPLPTLFFDMITEILCRLRVKVLLKLRCVCKSWNFLTSDSKFIKKHLQFHQSTTRLRLHYLSSSRPYNKYTLTSYRLDSVFTNKIVDKFKQSEYIEYSPKNYNGYYRWYNFRHFVDSCNGILCFADLNKGLVILWNPSLRIFKELPFFENPKKVFVPFSMKFGFGFDSSADKYKVVVLLVQHNKTKVKVHTVGTNNWRSIPGFPFDGVTYSHGKSVSGTINWLVYKDLHKSPRIIVSFDLANESFQKISPPCIGGVDVDLLSLGVLRDCLCVTSNVIFGDDVWIMKQYGNKDSWTKLFTVPCTRVPNKPYVCVMPIYIFEDDQVLLNFCADLNLKYLFLYNSKSGTLKRTNFKHFPTPQICVESLISPYSLC